MGPIAMVAFELKLTGTEWVHHAGIWARDRVVRRGDLCRGSEDSWCVGEIAGGSVSRVSKQGGEE